MVQSAAAPANIKPNPFHPPQQRRMAIIEENIDRVRPEVAEVIDRQSYQRFRQAFPVIMNCGEPVCFEFMLPG